MMALGDSRFEVVYGRGGLGKKQEGGPRYLHVTSGRNYRMVGSFPLLS